MLRICALEHARGFVGVAEQPPGSNRGPHIDGWLRDAGAEPGEPWCMAFVHGMFKLCELALGGWASVGSFELWAESHGYLIGRPLRGDCVCFEWEADSWPDHVGIVERVLAVRWRGGRFVGFVQTIEGNSGNAVRRNRRWVNARTRFARVPG